MISSLILDNPDLSWSTNWVGQWGPYFVPNIPLGLNSKVKDPHESLHVTTPVICKNWQCRSSRNWDTAKWNLHGLWIHVHDQGLDHRNNIRYGPSQWEATLHCNVVSYWLSPYQQSWNSTDRLARSSPLPTQVTSCHSLHWLLITPGITSTECQEPLIAGPPMTSHNGTAYGTGRCHLPSRMHKPSNRKLSRMGDNEGAVSLMTALLSLHLRAQ